MRPSKRIYYRRQPAIEDTIPETETEILLCDNATMVVRVTEGADVLNFVLTPDMLGAIQEYSKEI